MRNMKIKLGSASLERLSEAMCGDSSPWPYRTYAKISLLLAPYKDRAADVEESSRGRLASAFLVRLNNSESIEKLFLEILDPRHFVGSQPDRIIDHGAAVAEMGEFLKYDGYSIVERGGRWKVELTGQNLVGIEKITQGMNPLDAQFIDEYVGKCHQCIKDEDYSGAIRSSRSMCEQVLQAMAADLGIELNDSDDLGDLLKKVTAALGMRGEKLDVEFKQITGSLSGLIQAVGAVRNRMGDAHRRSVQPPVYYAELCVDSAFAASKFIVAVFRNYKLKSGK